MRTLDESTTSIIGLVVAKACSCVGVPYRSHGRDRCGLDCAGLLYVVFQGSVPGLVDFHDYGAEMPMRRVFRPLWRCADRVAVADVRPADVVVLRCSAGLAHVAIACWDGRIVHVDNRIGRVVQHQMEASSVAACFRMRGLK